MQRVGEGDLGQLARLPVGRSLEDQVAGVDQHADVLDRIQRNPTCRLDDERHHRLRNPRCQPGDQLGHLGIAERAQVGGEEVVPGGSPARVPVEQLGASQGDDEDRMFGRHLDQLLDELELAVVGPVQVFKQEHRGLVGGYSLEEGAQRGEQLVAVPRGHFVEAEQPGEPRLDPLPLLRIGDELGDDGTQLGARLQRLVGLSDVGAGANHLGQGPKSDAVAVCGGAALMPAEHFGEAVDVFQQFPGKAALADPGLADDRH